MFKINSIKKSTNKKSHAENSSFFLLEINFSVPEEETHFGMLGEYYKAIVLLDREKYEQHYADFDRDDVSFVDIEDSEFKQMVFKKPSPYVLGYCKTLDCIGSDVLSKKDDGSYNYKQYISSNYITKGVVRQLKEMKEHIDKQYCRYGDYPDQIGAFRSGLAYYDFLAALECLDKFWD